MTKEETIQWQEWAANRYKAAREFAYRVRYDPKGNLVKGYPVSAEGWQVYAAEAAAMARGETNEG